MSDKINALDNFNTGYKLFNEGDRRAFSRIVSKLLSETFILKEKESDRTDFLFARENNETFTAYFELIDYEFIYNRYNELCYIKTTENRNRVRLNKFDTALILITKNARKSCLKIKLWYSLKKSWKKFEQARYLKMTKN